MFTTKNCPYCGNSMKEGYIESESSSGLFWIPSGKSLGLEFLRTRKAVKKVGGLILDGPYWTKFNAASVLAFCCELCEKIIIEL